MNNFETLNGYPTVCDEVGKFIVRLSFEDEHCAVEDLLDDEKDIRAIINGEYTWTIATVTVFKNGIELADRNIGACTYKYDSLIEDFKDSGYYDDMVSEAISDAEQVLKELLS